MKTLPLNVTAYNQTPVFNENTVPKAMQHQHATKEGSWGKFCVISGQIRYKILSNPPEECVITSEVPGIIEPEIPHKVELIGPVEFFLEFYH